jgi:hypothetical protein
VSGAEPAPRLEQSDETELWVAVGQPNVSARVGGVIRFCRLGTVEGKAPAKV